MINEWWTKTIETIAGPIVKKIEQFKVTVKIILAFSIIGGLLGILNFIFLFALMVHHLNGGN